MVTMAGDGIGVQQRERLIEEARARLEWAGITGEVAAAEAVRDFARTVLAILEGDGSR